jgi:hypothetical protein
MTTRMRLLIARALTVVVFLSVGCSGNDTAKKGDQGSGQKKDIEGPKPDFSLTAKAFAEEFQGDEKAVKAAEAKYRSKVIELSGVVGTVGYDSDGKPWLSFPALLCYTEDKEPWRKVMPGQTAKIRGKLLQSKHPRLAALLVDCVISEVSGSEPPTVTAAELGKEYAADPAATAKKYQRPHYQHLFFVRGEISRVRPPVRGQAAVAFFKTAGKPEVSVWFGPLYKKEFAALKVGQKIKVLGVRAEFPRRDEVSVVGDGMYIFIEEGGK